jgi:rhodanese-related sulfurtransferase
VIDPLTCEEVRTLLARGAQLVDVRTPGEHAAGALPGAKNLPVEAIYQWMNQLDPAQPVLLYCRSGAARNFFRSMGFREAYNLGAYQQWRDCAGATG